VRLITRASLTPMPWKNGGGVTRQIACFPSGSDITSFDWRLSTAEVTQDGPFSPFPGIDRRLYILEGAGLDLRLADGTQRLRQGQHIDFAGEAAVFGALIDGPVTDFNIMVRRDRMRMRAETLRIAGSQEIDHGWGTAALFVLGGELAVIDGAARRFDTVLLDDARPLNVSGTAEVLLIGLEALD
jgi:environmental stress-induced protein Ves